MILYIAIAVALIINIINPRILWRIDSWKYKNASKAEPSPLYLFLCRGLSLLGVTLISFLMQGIITAGGGHSNYGRLFSSDEFDGSCRSEF